MLVYRTDWRRGKKAELGDALEDFVGIPGIHEYLDYDINSTNEK